ncbi:glycerol-3-phosphate 1-O-acyltransferase PlsY [beta proteobacterium MWH-UniP1]
MSFEFIIFLIGLLSYLVGSISFAIVVSRLRGIDDPRTYGSHNPGATNVLRSGDKVAAALTLLGDAAKGLVMVLTAKAFAELLLPADWHLAATAVAGFSVFLGHLFPVYFRFQGGKGVATAFGVLLAFDPVLGAMVGVLWLFMAKVSGISSLAALTAATAAPLITLWRHGLDVTFWSVLGIAVLLVIRHKKNIAQLLSGQEKSFKKKS